MRPKSAKRLAFAEAQNWRCCYCSGVMSAFESGPALATREHVVPNSLGGTPAAANTVSACQGCNIVRGADFPAFRFAKLRRHLVHNRYWAPCTFPSRRAKRLIQEARVRLSLTNATPTPGSCASVVLGQTLAAELPQDGVYGGGSCLQHVGGGTLDPVAGENHPCDLLRRHPAR